jgi:hypothetical protein
MVPELAAVVDFTAAVVVLARPLIMLAVVEVEADRVMLPELQPP